ncbi:MAG TPA: flagellar hook protein FlgE [Candidatus Aquilonibacter sp.]
MAFDSLFIGVSGLTAYQSQIDVISNNIANVGTVGYKGQDVTFQDLLYQNTGFASAPTQKLGGINAQQVGDGVRIGAIDTDYTQGGLQTTGINTNLAINGNGFFTLNNIDGSGSATYTRDGDFSLNQSGYLYDPTSGKAVLGYPVQSNGTISQVAPPQPIQIPFGLKSIAVGTGFGAKSGPSGDTNFDVSLGGNLNQTDYIAAVSSGGANLALTTITTTIYDSLGGAHEIQITYQPATGVKNGGVTISPATVIDNTSGKAVTAATEWQYTVTSTDGSTLLPTADSGYIWYDQNGQFINTSNIGVPGAGFTVHNAGTPPTGSAVGGSGDLLGITQWGTPAGANNATPVGPTTANPAEIGLDFSNMTSLATGATANTVSQNGYAAGILSNITIGEDGTITGAFTNGQNTTLGRLALASFANEDGLSRVGANQFTSSANSGLAQYGFANSGQLGSIDAGALEQSNVSIASEFTKMILAQRSFEANAKSITTADQNLQTVLQLKQ